MSRMRLNLVAAFTIMMGATFLAVPPRASATEGDACCVSPNGGCCGDQCRISGGKCTWCDGWRCLLF